MQDKKISKLENVGFNKQVISARINCPLMAAQRVVEPCMTDKCALYDTEYKMCSVKSCGLRIDKWLKEINDNLAVIAQYYIVK